MKSAVQFTIGAGILVTAFVVGSRWPDQPSHGARTAEELQNEDLVWHSLEPHGNETSEAAQRASGTLSNSNPASQRREANGAGPMLPPDNPSSELSNLQPRPNAKSEPIMPVAPAASEKVVMPDFRKFEQQSPTTAMVSPVLEDPNTAEIGKSPSAPPLIAQKPPFDAQPQPAAPPGLAPMREIAPNDPGLAQPLPKEFMGRSIVGAAVSPPANAPAIVDPSRRLAPLRLNPDQELRLQTDEFRVYVTRSGDSLQRIAEQQMGSTAFYLDIYLANQDSLSSPAVVPVGIPLKIPIYREN